MRNERLTRATREHVVRCIAAHRLTLLPGQYVGQTRTAILETVAVYTEGLDPIERARLFDTVTKEIAAEQTAPGRSTAMDALLAGHRMPVAS